MWPPETGKHPILDNKNQVLVWYIVWYVRPVLFSPTSQGTDRLLLSVYLLRLPVLHKQNGKARGPRGPSGWGRLRGEGGRVREDEGLFTFVLCLAAWETTAEERRKEEDCVWIVCVCVCLFLSRYKVFLLPGPDVFTYNSAYDLWCSLQCI